MKKEFLSVEKDGFYGTYYENPKESDCVIIGLFGDDPNDYMAKCGAKWLHKNAVNCLAMSPGKKDYSHVNFPLERVETAIKWLQKKGNRKIGIMGMSTAGMHAITAASYFQDITFTIGLTASDFVWQGFEQGKKDGCKEWPIPNASTLSYGGKPLSYMPFVYEHPEYWHKVEAETKGSGDIERSTCLFIDSEANRPHREEEMIKVENINGKLFLIGADDGLKPTGCFSPHRVSAIKHIKRRIFLIKDPSFYPIAGFCGHCAGTVQRNASGIYIHKSASLCHSPSYAAALPRKRGLSAITNSAKKQKRQHKAGKRKGV